MAGPALRLKIVQAGEPVLRQRARALSPEEIRSTAIQELIEHMRETMHDAPGVGLAAPQIGQNLQLAVIEDRAEYQKGLSAEELTARAREPVPFHVIVNPEIVARSEETAVFHEGCLSLAGFSAQVERARAVRVSCLDHRGETRIIEASGWYARILQHEIDHLHGGLYIDRMDPRSFTSQANYARYGKGETR
ncbi:MAG: peptide deformylase [Methylococcus sp.]|nr:peptide deformylase [Methylococcus sp.]